MKKIFVCMLCVIMLLAACVPAFAAQQKLDLDAKAAVLMDLGSGKVLYALRENDRRYPASVTKVMSLLLVMEALESGKLKLEDKIAASETAVSFGGSQIWLEVGEKMSVDDMLKAVTIASANDSSEAFVAAMNERADQLGLKNTHFENCTGLDENEKNHYSSALDIALMSRALMRYERIQTYSSTWMDSLRGGKTELVNTNRLVRFYNGCIGLKTGTTTKAGFCVSAVAKRGGTTLCAVILGAENSDERFNSAARLLDYGFANFESVSPEIELSAAQVGVVGGTEETLPLTLAASHPLVSVPKGEGKAVVTKLSLPESVRAPVEKGEAVGKAAFYLGKECLGSVDILSARRIDKLDFWSALIKLLQSGVTNIK